MIKKSLAQVWHEAKICKPNTEVLEKVDRCSLEDKVPPPSRDVWLPELLPPITAAGGRTFPEELRNEAQRAQDSHMRPAKCKRHISDMSQSF